MRDGLATKREKEERDVGIESPGNKTAIIHKILIHQPLAG
jgi:hypothetical protein